MSTYAWIYNSRKLHAKWAVFLVAACLLITDPAFATGTPSMGGTEIGSGSFAIAILSIPTILLLFSFSVEKTTSRFILLSLPTIVSVWMFLSFHVGSYISTPYVFINAGFLIFYVSCIIIRFVDHHKARLFSIVFFVIYMCALLYPNPYVVNYDYFTFVDNNPAHDPNTRIQPLYMRDYGIQYIKLPDGRVLKSDKPTSINYISFKEPLELTEKAGSFMLSYTERKKMTSSQKRALKVHKKAFFKKPRNEIVIHKYEKIEFGSWSLVKAKKVNPLILKYKLKRALKKCEYDKIKSLVDQGAEIVKDPYPIKHAIYNECVRVVELFLREGAKVDHLRHGDYTLLHDAASRAPKITSLLIQSGAKLNAVTERGDTPLHIAARLNTLEAVLLLVNSGADTNIKNNAGDTPLESARKYHNAGYSKKGEGEKIIKLFEKMMNQ